MADHRVSLTIDMMGNAVKGVGSLAAKIGNIGLRLSGVIQSVGAITGKLKEFSVANQMQQEAETKLAQVMRNTMDAGVGEINAVKELTAAQQRLGIIGDEVQIAGAQELGTYLSKTESLQKLLPVMNDMLAQQYGLNASQEQAVQIGSMMGKVMDGQVGALSRYGYKFDENQKRLLQFGTEEQRVATLAEVIEQSVGGMNEALAATPEGRIKQMENRMGDLKESVGKLFTDLKTAAMPFAELGVSLLEKMMPVVSQVVAPIERGLQTVFAWVEKMQPAIMQIRAQVQPLINSVKSNFGALLSQLGGMVSVVEEHVVPAFQNIFGVVSRIAGKLIEFVSHSTLVKDIFNLIFTLCGKVYDIVSDVFSAVEWLFNKIILPALQAIEKAYKWIKGESSTTPTTQPATKPTPTANSQLVEAVNGKMGARGTVADGGTMGSGKSSATSVVTGGTRSNNITINLKSLVEKMVFDGGFAENRNDMRRQIAEDFLQVLNMAQASVS